MTQRPSRSGAAWPQCVLAILAAGLLAGFTVGCGAVLPSSSPAGCVDTRGPGTAPELEALLPRGMIERSPDQLDSGWSCSPDALGTYAAHGVQALWFAGATWNQGAADATVVAILATRGADPPLQVAWVEEFYETGARSSTKTENIEVSRPTMAGPGVVYRLETLNELSLQTVVVWPEEPYVYLVIVATQVAPGASRLDHNRRVATAVLVAAGLSNP